MANLDQHLRVMLGNRDVWFGGLPVLLAGDFHQMQSPGIKQPIFERMVLFSCKDSSVVNLPTNSTIMSTSKLLVNARFFRFTRIVRALTDEAFQMVQAQMRRTDVLHPIPRPFLDKIGALSRQDHELDPLWRFPAFGVLGNLEKERINHEQLMRFARALDLPVFRWKRPLCRPREIPPETLETLYREEECALHEFFVQGTPVLFSNSTCPVRGFVRGAKGILYGLKFKAGGFRVRRVVRHGERVRRARRCRAVFGAGRVRLGRSPEPSRVVALREGCRTCSFSSAASKVHKWRRC